MMIRNLMTGAALLAAATFGQDYKTDVGAAPPAEASAYTSVLEAKSVRVLDSSGKVFCELWLRNAAPPEAKSTESNVTLPELAQGTLMGVIQFPANGADRRGQQVKPGIYTLRYSNFPISGDHQGVAPQRDFLVLSKIADDTDAASTPRFDALMSLSRKASGTNHPLVLSIWKADSPATGFGKEGEHDWVLTKSVGKIPLAIILVGRSEG
jgi:hypothetical protein